LPTADGTAVLAVGTFSPEVPPAATPPPEPPDELPDPQPAAAMARTAIPPTIIVRERLMLCLLLTLRPSR
jgi:hypothetical protein